MNGGYSMAKISSPMGSTKESRAQFQQFRREQRLQEFSAFYFKCAAQTISRNGCHRVRWRPPKELDENGEIKISDRERKLFDVDRKRTKGIDFDKYSEIEVHLSGRGKEDFSQLQDFQNFKGLPDFLVRNIRLCKYSNPTPVQKYSIPVTMEGRDVMCCAQTGSGKTAAFLLPLFAARINPEPPWLSENGTCLPQGLVLAPTRELACQIHVEALKFSNRSNFRSVCVYGGAALKSQLKELALGADLLVATPGRLIDLLTRGVTSMMNCRYLCLDEADRMLDMGFEPQIRHIVEQSDMPTSDKGRQTLMFSATFPDHMQKLAADFMNDYVWIGVGRVGATTDSITQKLVEVTPDTKIKHLGDLLAEVTGSTLVFVAKKKTAGWLARFLSHQGHSCVCIHGDMSQVDRMKSLMMFKNNRCRLLVATDVAARGLDISGVTHVINFDLPSNIDDYIHRIGRTGRAGCRGLATSLVVPGMARDGNSNIAKPMIRVLKEANQEIPQFLKNMADQLRRNNRGGGNRNDYYNPGKFGGYDFRNSQQWGRPSRGGRGRGGYNMYQAHNFGHGGMNNYGMMNGGVRGGRGGYGGRGYGGRAPYGNGHMMMSHRNRGRGGRGRGRGGRNQFYMMGGLKTHGVHNMGGNVRSEIMDPSIMAGNNRMAPHMASAQANGVAMPPQGVALGTATVGMGAPVQMMGQAGQMGPMAGQVAPMNQVGAADGMTGIVNTMHMMHIGDASPNGVASQPAHVHVPQTHHQGQARLNPTGGENNPSTLGMFNQHGTWVPKVGNQVPVTQPAAYGQSGAGKGHGQMMPGPALVQTPGVMMQPATTSEMGSNVIPNPTLNPGQPVYYYMHMQAPHPGAAQVVMTAPMAPQQVHQQQNLQHRFQPPQSNRGGSYEPSKDAKNLSTPKDKPSEISEQRNQKIEVSAESGKGEAGVSLEATESKSNHASDKPASDK